MKKKTRNRDLQQSVKGYSGGVDAWMQTSADLCELGGFEAQPEGYRFQIRKRWVSILRPYSGQQWYGWVPGGRLCCRFVPEIARGLFEDDLAEWQSEQRNDNASLPAGDAAVKTLFEPRGRITLPDALGLAIGAKKGHLIFVQPRRGFLEVWLPDNFTAYCTRLAQRPTSGGAALSQARPQETILTPAMQCSE
jgi:hypothetical protein